MENTPIGLSTMSPEMENADNYNRWIFSKFKKYVNNKILEVGTGHGNFAQFLPAYETYVSIDIDEKVIEKARKKDDKRIYLILDAASDNFSKELSAYHFDTVICVNVLEHIADHKRAFENMISVLGEEGHLLLFVPALEFLFNDMDKLAGHHRRYTKTLFRALFDDADYQLVKMEYFNPVGAAGWWANKFSSPKTLNSSMVNRQVKLFDKYLVHLSKILNPFTRSFFGQSLICIYKKNKV